MNKKYEELKETLKGFQSEKRVYIDKIEELLENIEKLERSDRKENLKKKKFYTVCIDAAVSILAEISEEEIKTENKFSNLLNDALGEIYEEERGIQEEFD